MSIREEITELQGNLPQGVTLVAVSKTYPAEDIMEAYHAGQRIFGESRPQELKAKYELLPKDIQWHMIGHLQTNKVKYIAPFVEMIHSVDSVRLLQTIDREGEKNGRNIGVLLEVHIAQESSKHGFNNEEIEAYIASGAHLELQNVTIRGLMGIATFTDDTEQVRSEFRRLKEFFDRLREKFFSGGSPHGDFDTLSMGMTADYPQAIECGSTMVRIGSMIFGARDYSNN